MIFTTGQTVTLTCAGCTVPAEIALASSNGRSLMLRFDAALGHRGLYMGMMPVLMGDDGVFYDLVENQPVTIEGLAP